MSSRLKEFVNNSPVWESFKKELDEEIEMSRKALEQEADTQKIFQRQGQIQAYNRLKKLRDKVNG